MSVQERIEQRLNDAFNPAHLEVINESGMHNVPPGSESHFKVMIVTDAFEGKALIARHRLINQTLSDELAGPIHALSLHTHTPAEWVERGGSVPVSPPCHGGSKASA